MTMKQDGKKEEFVSYVARVQKQHSSLTVVIPRAIRQRLGINRGDIAIFDLCSETGEVLFSKFRQGDKDGAKT